MPWRRSANVGHEGHVVLFDAFARALHLNRQYVALVAQRRALSQFEFGSKLMVSLATTGGRHAG